MRLKGNSGKASLIKRHPLSKQPGPAQNAIRNIYFSPPKAITIGSPATITFNAFQGSAGQEKKLVAKGKSLFDVHWSVSVSTAGRLSKPKLISIESIETTWETV